MDYPITQSHFNQLATAGGQSACIARINLFHNASSVCSFVRSELDHLIPRSIRDRLGEITVLDHSSNVQFLKEDSVKPINQIARELMRKVRATVADAMVNYASGRASFLSLSFRQRLLVTTKEARIRDLFARRERGEMHQTNVNADHFISWWQRFGFRLFNGKDYKPLTCLILDRAGLNPTPDCTVHHDLDCSDLRERQNVAVHSEPQLWIAEAIEPRPRSESWKARLFACFNSSEKGVKGPAQSAQRILKDLRVDVINIRAFGFDLRKLSCLCVVVEALLIQTPRVPSLLKRRIVQLATNIQGFLKLCFHGFSWPKPELIGEHGGYYNAQPSFTQPYNVRRWISVRPSGVELRIAHEQFARP